jgi:hypothetical protein
MQILIESMVVASAGPVETDRVFRGTIQYQAQRVSGARESPSALMRASSV